MNEEIIRQNWENIKEHIRSEYQLSNISYKTWIEGLTISSIDKNTVTIQIPSDKMFMLNYIENNYRILFQITITEMLNENYEIAFVLQGQKAAQAAEPEPVRSSAYNVNYENAGLNSKYRFDTFVVGSNNKFAHSACLAVAESPGNAYNPLFLYGGAGLGKTHLMHSIGHFILEKDPSRKIIYVTSEQFTNEVIESIRSGNDPGGILPYL